MTTDLLSGHNVVSMMELLEDNRFPAVNEMQNYWDDLRGDRQVPLRSEVDPRKIENCLAYAFILERIAPGLARFRLAGTHLNDLIGMEVRGMPLTAIFAPDARNGLSELLEQVFSDPSVVQISLKAEDAIGKPPIDGRMILLPLKSDFGDVTRVLGCFVTQGAIGRTPRRFALTDAKLAKATGRHLGVPPLPLPDTTAAHSAGFAEARNNFTPAPHRPTVKGRPHLRLVASND